ncbi:MAG: dynamin family protein [Desulfamplus sp.]|nr:dynamin family protein [Desulfamplus sp.]
MKNNINIIESVDKLCSDLFVIFENMKKIEGMYDKVVERQHHLCKTIPVQIDEGIIKIAVVGAIKSGKSTFINSLLMDDVLKRGAGTVTSVITRVRRGNNLRALVSFKTWDEINSEIQKALQLTHAPSISSIDLRRKSDRDFLKNINHSNCSFINENGLRPEIILISNALDGYEKVKDFVQFDSDSPSLEFKGDNFSEYKRFTSVSSNALFVKDVLIEAPNDKFILIDPSIEIADCQGSDSTDPSHLSQIQDYLLYSNMLIYVVSSRTGLREADLKFLTIIKNTGIINNIIFILNADFNEHDSLESLIELEKSVKQGLEYFVENPNVYTLSSLFNLFSALEQNPAAEQQLSDKNLERLMLWKREIPLTEYTAKKSVEFENALKHKIESERFSIILENHIQRLMLVIQGLKQRNTMFMQLLSGDLKKATDATEKLKLLQEKSKIFESSLDDSIDIAVQNIKKDIASAINQFFDKNRGVQALKIKELIFGAAIYNERYQEMVSNYSFNHALYCMFNDFRVELDRFMTQHFNPAVIELIQDQEQYIEKSFETLYKSCYMTPSQIYPQLSLDEQSKLQIPDIIKAVDLKGAKRILGLNLPKSEFATAYSAKIKADAMARFSFYSLIEILGKFISSLTTAPPKSRALKESVKKIRKEALRSVMLHFDSYKHHVEQEYLFPLINAVARDLREKLMDMFHICAIESKDIEKLISDRCADKSDQLEHLRDIENKIDNISDLVTMLSI